MYGRAPRGRVIILSDGHEHCVERNVDGVKAVMKLNARLRDLNLRKPPFGGEGGNLPQADMVADPLPAPELFADGGPVPLGGENEKLEEAFTLLDQATQARSDMPVQVDVIGLDILTDPTAREQLRSMATAGGGKYVEATEPEQLENTITRILPPELANPGATPTAPVAGTQPTPISLDLVVCSDVVNGKPIGVTDHFPQATKICAFWRFVDQTDGTVATAIWKREGQEYARSDQPVAGTGGAIYSMSNYSAGGHPAGNYEIAIVINGAAVATRQFRVGSAQPPTTQPPATQPPTTQPTMPGGQAPPAGVIDAVLFAGQDGGDFREGVVLGFDGTQVWFSGEGGTITITKDKMYLLFIGDPNTTIPHGIRAGTMILKDGTLVSGTLTRFDGRVFTVNINGEARSFLRDQVLVVCLGDVD